MARKRMLDPEIWDSALSKGWSPEDFTVMVAAISTADDEGRGLVSVLQRNVTPMISTAKFQKSLRNLEDSIKIYGKIYFQLPNWKKYQSISHPKPSKFPEPNSQENNNLTLNSSEKIPETFRNDSDTVKVKVREVSLKEVKSKGIEPEQLPEDLTFNTPSSFTFKDFTPTDFTNDEELRAVIILMLARFCKITAPEKAEVSRFFNIITKTENIIAKGKYVSRRFAHKIALDTFREYKNFEDNKRNLPYLSKKIIGKINDAIIVWNEKQLTEQKNKLNKELTEASKSDVFNDFQSFAKGFANEHKL